jgi:tetratricopeptide (TPR) repeat protein
MNRAIKDYSKVIELDIATTSERADVFQNRANAYEARGEQGDMDSAIEDYTTAINFAVSGKSGSANKYDLLKDRGYAYIKLGRRDLMLNDFKTICREAANSEQCRIVKKDMR